MLVLHTNPVEVEIFSYVNAFFSSKKICMDAGHVNENALLVKISKTTFFARASRFFVHFFAVVARLRRETS